jgi:hypothetical protein
LLVITEKGTLPVGIEKDGKFHREFEIRPALVRDTIEVADEEEPKKLENASYYGICLTAKQIVRIGDIFPLSPELVMGMLDEDFGEIAKAKARLAARLKSFHGYPGESGKEQAPDGTTEDKAEAEADPGIAQVASAAGSDT